MTSGRQPLLHDAVLALQAPTQAWSRNDADMRAPIDGIYHGDRRFVTDVALLCARSTRGDALEPPEWIGTTDCGAGRVVFDAVLRDDDDSSHDPQLRLTRTRTVTDGAMRERLELRSALTAPVVLTVQLRLSPDFRSLSEVKSGYGAARPWRAAPLDGMVRVTCDEPPAFTIAAPGAEIEIAERAIVLTWTVAVAPRASATVAWTVDMMDPELVVIGAPGPAWAAPVDAASDGRLDAWLRTALDDLAALRLALPGHPEDVFLAAGAPWFLTLFGRDCLWAARMLLPIDPQLAASTLRVLARLQGTRDDPETEEQPGRIAHERRSASVVLPRDATVLPPLYYGTVDATPLWVCLLHDAHEAGLPEPELRALLPAMRDALDWVLRTGGDGFVSYAGRTGSGLANQGWKDSGDSIQWRDGALADAPIALCEVQGYAYEAAMGGARLLELLGEPGAPALRDWASALRERFRQRFWVTTPEGTYPAVALDRDGRAVDSLTSNIGHLLGTGILDADEERTVADLLIGPTMATGFGIRTLSSRAAGYWPLGYHIGSVWPHDTAIVARGMQRCGLDAHARRIAQQLLDGAAAFGYRVPELFGGDEADGTGAATPYPAACRPQAWSAAAAVVCLDLVRSH